MSEPRWNEYLDTPEVLADAQRHWSPEELTAGAVARGALTEPGSGHHYANTNYILLGELIAQMIGLPWYAAVRQRILTLLAMPHTAYVGEKGAPPMGPGYGIVDGQFVANDLTLEGHAGSAPAHGSFIGLDPDSGLVITVLINSNEPAPSPVMSLEVAGALTGKDVSPPQDPSIPPAALAD